MVRIDPKMVVITLVLSDLTAGWQTNEIHSTKLLELFIGQNIQFSLAFDQDTVLLLYIGKIWRGKIMADLANG